MKREQKKTTHDSSKCWMKIWKDIDRSSGCTVLSLGRSRTKKPFGRMGALSIFLLPHAPFFSLSLFNPFSSSSFLASRSFSERIVGGTNPGVWRSNATRTASIKHETTSNRQHHLASGITNRIFFLQQVRSMERLMFSQMCRLIQNANYPSAYIQQYSSFFFIYIKNLREHVVCVRS